MTQAKLQLQFNSNMHDITAVRIGRQIYPVAPEQPAAPSLALATNVCKEQGWSVENTPHREVWGFFSG